MNIDGWDPPFTPLNQTNHEAIPHPKVSSPPQMDRAIRKHKTKTPLKYVTQQIEPVMHQENEKKLQY